MILEEQLISLDPEETLPVIFLNGVTAQATPVPTLYAIRFFCRELESAGVRPKALSKALKKYRRRGCISMAKPGIPCLSAQNRRWHPNAN